MTDYHYIDTDCLSSFFCANRESILIDLYNGRLILPMEVYGEIRKVPQFRGRLESFFTIGSFRKESIIVGTEEAALYMKLTHHPDRGLPIIGSGEAAAIAMCYYRGGILISGNFSDVIPYVKQLNLRHLGVADIFVEAINVGIITDIQGNEIWKNMVSRNRKLPFPTLIEFLENK